MAAVAVASVLALAVMPAAGQTPAYRAPRTADGKPDLNGIWQAVNTAGWDLQGHAAAHGPVSSLGAVFAVPPGLNVVEGDEIPYLPAAATKRRKMGESWIRRSSVICRECLALQSQKYIMIYYEYAGAVRDINIGAPTKARADSWNNLLQIMQGEGYVVLLQEIDHSTRVIPTDGRPHIPQNIRQYQGHTVGDWDGNTLVVDATNFTALTAFRGSSEKLHLVERFTRPDENRLLYQFTVEDPTTWDKPWTAEIPMAKTHGPVYEWACHERNADEFMTILRGARVAQEDAAKKAGK